MLLALKSIGGPASVEYIFYCDEHVIDVYDIMVSLSQIIKYFPKVPCIERIFFDTHINEMNFIVLYKEQKCSS